MDAIYSEAFDHLRPLSGEAGDGYTDIIEVDSIREHPQNIARTSAVKKRSGQFVPQPQPDIHDDMGQGASSDYIDVFDVNPNIDQPPHRRQTQSRSVDHAALQQDIGGLAEYSYASSVEREGPGERRSAPVKQRSISVTDDYCQPQDRVSICSKGDYTEPYEAQLNNGGAEGAAGGGQQAADGEVYQLAKDVDQLRTDRRSLTNQESTESNTYDSTTNSAHTTAGMNTGETYDHINNWQSKGMRLDPNVHQAAEVGALKSAEKCLPNSNNYEEPWDSMQGQERLSSLMERAKKTDGRRQSVEQQSASKDTAPAPQSSQDGFKGRRRPKPLRTAPSPSSSSSSSQVYEAAWEGPKDGKHKSSPAPTRVQKQVRQDYEDAWDSPGMQQQFEEKLEMARKQRASLDQGTRVSQEQVVADLPRSPIRTSPSPVASPIRRKARTEPDHVDFSPGQWKSGDHSMVARSDSCLSLGALAEKVDMSLALKKQPFFHGKLKRSEAERLLLVYKEGSYLIRQSESCKKDFSLTLKGWNSLPMHMKICCQADGTYVLGENSPPFKTIPEMINYYTNHELPVQDADRICLLYMIPS